MKKIIFLMMALFLSSCVSLSYQEKVTLKKLKKSGLNAEISANGWEKPVNPLLAGALNILPGFGNFYLSSEDDHQKGYGILNLLFWPLSVVWGVPQAYIDARTLNKRDLASFYQYVKEEQQDSQQAVERPQWVVLYEKEGYIGQTDKKVIHYIGYGESIYYKLAHDDAVEDAYEKAMASITGYGDSSKRIPIHGMHLSSEYKEETPEKFKVWILYSYPRSQMERDIRDFQDKNKKKNLIH